MPNHSKRRQSRLGRIHRKPTDSRRTLVAEPYLTPADIEAALAVRGVKVVTTDRVKGGLRYNIVKAGRPRTLKVATDAD